jgi:hypothetical protein
MKGQKTMKNKTYKVIIAMPFEKAGVYQIPASTDVLAKLVGGVMEFTNPITDDVTVITNDNSIALGMEPNRVIRDEDGDPVDVYCGPMIIIGENEDGELRSLTESEIILNLMAYGEPDFKKDDDEGEAES